MFSIDWDSDWDYQDRFNKKRPFKEGPEEEDYFEEY